MVEEPLVNERDSILSRIRDALAVAAPRPEPGPAPASSRRWLPKVGDSFEQRLSLFRAQAADLKAEFHQIKSREELNLQISLLREAGAWKRVATHAGELTEVACEAVGVPVLRTDSGYDVRELESCDAGITECDALIAQTGSVLVTSRSAGGRALSVLPPHHVVIARREQLLPDLTAAFELLSRKYAPDYPSFISFITGPSRTGDIERILVLGAHGPRKLTILCV
jgi:L-lactate dehydrogenase complex protein LldG